MRTDILSDYQTILTNGGSIYWLIIIYPNTQDAWTTPIAFANISNSNEAGFDLKTNRLVSISDIDQSLSGDFIESPIAKEPSVDFEIQNSDNYFSVNNYNGHEVEIKIGFGSNVTIATSILVFKGKITGGKVSRGNIYFNCSGLIVDKEIGTKLPDSVDNKFKGKIYPIIYGDWTDDNAYAPCILNRERTKIPDIILGDRALKKFQSLCIYSSSSKRKYHIIFSDTPWFNTKFQLSSGNNLLSFAIDEGITLASSLPSTEEISSIYFSGAGFDMSGEEDAVYFRIVNGDEYEIVKYAQPRGPSISSGYLVERGCCGTERKYLPAGSNVYKIDNDITDGKIKARILLTPIGVTHEKDFTTGSSWVQAKTTSGKSEYINDYENYVIGKSISNDIGSNGSAISEGSPYPCITGFNLIFEKTDVEADIIAKYLLILLELKQKFASDYGSSNSKVSKAQICTTTESVDLAEINSASYEESQTVTKTVDSINFPIDFDSIDISSLNVDKISDIDSKPFILKLNSMWTIPSLGNGTYAGGSYATMTIKKIKFMFHILLDVVKNDFYAECEGRSNPGSYFNGSSGDLIENPSSVVEDFIRTSVPGLSESSMDEESFDLAYTARADWKLAKTIFIE